MRIFILICCWASLFWAPLLTAKPSPAVQIQLLVSAVTVDQYEIAVLIKTLEPLAEVQLNLRLDGDPAWAEPSLDWSGALPIGVQRLVLAEQLRLADLPANFQTNFPTGLRAELLGWDRYGESHYAEASQRVGATNLVNARSLKGRSPSVGSIPGLHLIELSRP